MVQIMKENKRKTVSLSMISYELRNVTGNPFVHIFGIGLPIFFLFIITRMTVSELQDASLIKTVSTTVFLGISTLIPMAMILMGYSVMQSQDIEKGIPERLQLFGIEQHITICNRIISELIFLSSAIILYFLVGIIFMDLQAPVITGIISYIFCILVFSIICFILGHAVATLLRKFSLTYCAAMLLYFVFMIFGGMMGLTYDNMSAPMQAVAKLLPVTYFNRDFYTIWTGESYNFVPILQSYLFLGAVSAVLLFIALKRDKRKGNLS